MRILPVFVARGAANAVFGCAQHAAVRIGRRTVMESEGGHSSVLRSAAKDEEQVS